VVAVNRSSQACVGVGKTEGERGEASTGYCTSVRIAPLLAIDLMSVGQQACLLGRLSLINIELYPP
jgi:hypothetical protein